jgi:hypothetical protein
VKLVVVCRAHTGGGHWNLHRLVIERPGTGVPNPARVAAKDVFHARGGAPLRAVKAAASRFGDPANVSKGPPGHRKHHDSGSPRARQAFRGSSASCSPMKLSRVDLGVDQKGRLRSRTCRQPAHR